MIKKTETKKEETAMFTFSEAIVSLWFVPVVLCILVPLAMLCVWAFMKISKKMSGKIEQIEESAKKERDELLIENLQSQSTA